MRQWWAHGLLLTTAAVWGLAFVAQRVGMAYVGPLTFNAIRFTLGALVLLGIGRWRGGSASPEERRALARSGWLLGSVLFLGSSLQQAGLVYTTAGKAGFITGLYVVLVPLAGTLLLHERHGLPLWLGALLAVSGLYLLSVRGVWHMEKGDLLVLLSTFFWTAHVILVGRLTARHESLALAARQFLVVAGLSAAAALLWEPITWQGMRCAAPAILYGGLISVGIGYTLQVVAQKHALAAHAAIIMSLESVFALLGGALFLHEPLTPRGLGGAALMFGGMLLAQWPGKKPEHP